MKLDARTRTARRWRGRLALGLAALAVAVPASPAFGQIPLEPPPAAAGLAADVPAGPTAEDRRAERVATEAAPASGVKRGSFDWGDAAIGLGFGVGASVLLALGLVGVQRRRGTLAGA